MLAYLCWVPGRASVPMAVAGYVAGALATPAFTVAYRFRRRAAAQNPAFLPRTAVERWILLILPVGILGGIVNSWLIATWLAKL